METSPKPCLVKSTKTSSVEIVAMLFLNKPHTNIYHAVPIHQPTNHAAQSSLLIFYSTDINTKAFSGLCINMTYVYIIIMIPL